MSLPARPFARRPLVGRSVAIAGVGAAALAATAAWVAYKARQAEQQHRPRGTLASVDGVRVHYVDRGRGVPVVLVHGNAVRLQDFVASGLVDRLAQRFRVIAIDRPGYGYSERPRDRLWTAEEQAALLCRTLAELGVVRPIVLGHSWGTLVALALALRDDIELRKLILVSGYYYPTARLDVALAAPSAVPLLGDVMRHTVSAVTARLTFTRAVKAMFSPQPVPLHYMRTVSREMLLRPVQLRADAEDAAFMIPSAAALRERYAEVKAPTAIFAGAADKVVDPDVHARRLRTEIANSELHVLPGVGHMVHHTAPTKIVSSIAASETAARQVLQSVS